MISTGNMSGKDRKTSPSRHLTRNNNPTIMTPPNISSQVGDNRGNPTLSMRLPSMSTSIANKQNGSYLRTKPLRTRSTKKIVSSGKPTTLRGSRKFRRKTNSFSLDLDRKGKEVVQGHKFWEFDSDNKIRCAKSEVNTPVDPYVTFLPEHTLPGETSALYDYLCEILARPRLRKS